MPTHRYTSTDTDKSIIIFPPTQSVSITTLYSSSNSVDVDNKFPWERAVSTPLNLIVKTPYNSYSQSGK